MALENTLTVVITNASTVIIVAKSITTAINDMSACYVGSQGLISKCVRWQHNRGHLKQKARTAKHVQTRTKLTKHGELTKTVL
jgi:hypothetical protein